MDQKLKELEKALAEAKTTNAILAARKALNIYTFKTNIETLVSNDEIKLGIKNPNIKMETRKVYENMTNVNKRTVASMMNLLEYDCEVGRTKYYVTLNFKSELDRLRFLWQFKHPSTKTTQTQN